ncbi:hypothetical protein Q4599_10125 [Cellulophaga lytica]|uniref:hypothetical protein n=1 Tax=Cellulophaga lytica TaxID=979 RepID=UPI0026E24DD0|nr:hypothetical protein [Cellulophaga lytica]MDO6853936.1 hypothetical protein [Cellulophaga lytica]
MIRKIIIAIVCCMAGTIYAQNGTVSPYSYFGIGDLRSIGSVENQMMGGISMYADSIHINLNNPAAYARLRQTTYTASLSRKDINFKGQNLSDNSSVTNLDYLAIGFPIIDDRLGVGFGIKPFTSSGYEIEESFTSADNGEITNVFSGDGGVNSVFFSAGVKVIEDFTVGVTANYYFGVVDSRRVQDVEDVQYGTFDFRNSRVNGANFKISANYTPMLTDKIRMNTYFGVETQNNLSSENTKTIGSFSSSTGQEIETIEVDLDNAGSANRGVTIPTTTTVGLGFGQDRKWFIGTEYSAQNLEDYRAPFFTVSNLTYKNASKIAFGGFYIPDYTSFTSYYKRITYRAGARFENTGMVVNNEDIKDFGITFGLGLPLNAVNDPFSNINIGFEIGKRGTTNADLIQENYFKVNLGISLNSKWFRKRTIN